MKVSLYIESYCPDCEDFVTKDLVEFRKLSDLMAITDIDIVPYGNAHVITRDPPTFKCQHGEKECYGNYVELCAQKHYPDSWWDFLICQETSVDFSDNGVMTCAMKTSMDYDVILGCAKGTEGPLLHLEAADKTGDHKWVPWVIVDGKVLEEGADFIQAVCDAYQGEKPASCKKAEKVKASLYYESYCPGCEQFITRDLVEFHAMEDMMAITDLELVPYGNAHVITRDPPTFQCQHGDKECYGNYVELCAQKHFSDKWWEFIVCEETSTDFSDEGVTACAEKTDLNAATILGCAKGIEGPQLHLEAADKTPSHKWVPWVIVDGKIMGEEDNFLDMVCDAYKGEKPASCKKTLGVEKVKATLYYESYCPGCEQFITRDLVEFHAMEDMMAITDLELVPYGNAHVITRDPPTFQCQHGDKECYGNYVELCAQKHFSDKWWEFIVCEETSTDFSDEGVTACAEKTDLNAATILGCAKGIEGPQLHLEAADKTPSHKWVPWVIVDGKIMGEEDNFLDMVCDAYKGEKPASCKKTLGAEKVKASLYYESYCPGCETLIRSQIKDIRAMEDIMAITDLELVPYGNAHVITRDPPTFECQHGEKECYGNFVELCAQKHFSDEEAWKMILCEETSTDFSDEGVAACAKEAGIDAAVILECAKGTEGPLLHLEAADKTPRDHKWVPWVVVDGKVRDREPILTMICDAYKGEKPASCKQ